MNCLKNVKFEKSVYEANNLLQTDLPIIAIVGKSNVGKSSLINALANMKKLAKVSSEPGKTRGINYYNVNNELFLVDLPGYGYSKMSGNAQTIADSITNVFLETQKNIKHIFFILDIRHEPTKEDIQMYNWLLHFNYPFIVILNKSDKLSKQKQQEAIDNIKQQLKLDNTNIIALSAYKKENIASLFNYFC